MEFTKYCVNNTCRTDLHLGVQASYRNVSGQFILGASDLNLTVTVNKSGDLSYGSKFYLFFEKTVLFEKVHQKYGEQIECSLETEDRQVTDGNQSLPRHQMENLRNNMTANRSVLACTFGNPMKNDMGFECNVSKRACVDLYQDPLVLF